MSERAVCFGSGLNCCHICFAFSWIILLLWDFTEWNVAHCGDSCFQTDAQSYPAPRTTSDNFSEKRETAVNVCFSVHSPACDQSSRVAKRLKSECKTFHFVTQAKTRVRDKTRAAVPLWNKMKSTRQKLSRDTCAKMECNKYPK